MTAKVSIKNLKINTDFRGVLKKIHENKWVALSSDQKKVVAYSSKLMDLVKKVAIEDVVFMKVHPSDVFFAF